MKIKSLILAGALIMGAVSADQETIVIDFSELIKNKKDDEILAQYNNIVKNEGITVVKLSAIWCGPCKSYKPNFEVVAKEMQEIEIAGKKVKINYVAVDIDSAQVIAKDLAVMSVPATVFYNNGERVEITFGYLKKDELVSQIKQIAK